MPSTLNNPSGRSLHLFGLLALSVAGFVFWGGMGRNDKLAELEEIYVRMARIQAGALPTDAGTVASLNHYITALEEGLLLKERELFRGSPGSLSTEVAGNSTAAFFELAGFIEATYAKLEANSIGYVAGDRFGFSQFAQQGPESNILDAVMEQKWVAEHLLEQLIAAKPARLTGMKREWITQAREEAHSALAQAAGNQTSSAPAWEDTIAQRDGRPGYVSYVFEVGFEGYTGELRNFLIGLMAAPVPILVHDLSVEPLDRFAGGEADFLEEEGIPPNPFDLLGAARDDPAEGSATPIIQSNLSTFTLTLETILRKQAPAQ